MFADSFASLSDNKGKDDYPDIKEFDKKVILSMEKEITGLYLSGHPLDEYRDRLEHAIDTTTADIAALEDSMQGNLNAQVKALSDGDNVTVGGIILHKKTKTTKNNSMMAFITLEDLYGQVEAIVFPKILSKYSQYIHEDNIVVIKGRISIREDEQPKILCQEVIPVNQINKPERLYIKIRKDKKSVLEEITSILKFFNGDVPVYVFFEENNKLTLASRDKWVKLSDILLSELKNIVGDDCVKVV